MKHFFLIFIAVIFGILTHAQTQFEVSGDGSNKTLRGTLSRELITSDPSLSWAHQQDFHYTPDAHAVTALRLASEKLQLMVFVGTWSGESQQFLPRLFLLMDAAGFPDNQLTLYGVDRDWRMAGNTASDMHVSSAPLIIVLKDGKECGRIDGINTYWDKTLGQLLDQLH